MTIRCKIYHEALLSAVAVMALFCVTASYAGESAELNAVDSLLNVYAQSDRGGKVSIGRRLISIYKQSDAFLDEAPTIGATMPADSLDLVVYYATDRFYVVNAYYAEALDYNERATKHGSRQQPNIHATLLCDRAYCLYKTSRLSMATEAGQEAVRYCQQTGNLLQLSRAYLYLAIINVNISTDNRPQAKKFILKAIDTNRKAGPNRQLHNTLGVASEIFCAAGEVEKAIDYGLQAVAAAEDIGYEAGVANHLSQLSYAYNRNRQYQLGLETAERAIAMVEAMNIPDRNLLAISMEYKGWNLLDLGHNAEAAEVLREAAAIEAEVGNTRAVSYDMKVICEALEPIDPQGALQALKLYTAMSDSMHTAQLQEALGQANASFRNDELQEKNAQERQTSRIILLASVSIVLLLIATIGALWWASRQKSRTNKTLKRLSLAREQFFTNVTHELRTPLTVVLGMSEKLNENTPPDQIATAGDLIHRQGEQLLSLVNQLLDLSKVSSAIERQPTRTTDIAAFTEMTVEGFSEMARKQGIAINFEAEDRPMVANIVPDYLQKVLNNLIGNALKFTEAGGEVNVGLARRKGKLTLTVADTGMGIDTEDLPHIFEPFFQSDPESGIGSGVGLTLVKQIVDALGGTIKAESEKGTGTKFTVEVPEASGPNPALSGATSSPLRVGIHIKQKSTPPLMVGRKGAGREDRPSILIVEDNADVAYYISSLLSDGYDVTTAQDGRQGLERAHELMPDLIITDIMMPHTDGLELCRQIRSDELTNHIPVIVVTAKATERDRLRGLEAGADAYLYKPFNADELHLRIEKLLEQRRLLQEKYRVSGIQSETQVLPSSAASSTSLQERGLVGEPEGGESVSLREQAEIEFLERMKTNVHSLMADGVTDVDSVAARLFLSPSQLRRKLQAITGTTPAQYILDIRLAEACRLLHERPTLSLAEVAERCGFADQSHFNHAFRRRFGTTPRAYKKTED